jgi:prepilin-type N-terminal cleavage/methylation domain-containing protein
VGRRQLHDDRIGGEGDVRKAARRLLREEGGFTLSEMMVVTMMLTIVLFALYGIFDMSIRVFSFGNDKVVGGRERPGRPGEDGARDTGGLPLR